MEARESFWDLRVINLPKDAEGRIWHITAVRSVGVLPWWREAVVTWWGPSAPSSVLLANVYRVFLERPWGVSVEIWQGPGGPSTAVVSGETRRERDTSTMSSHQCQRNTDEDFLARHLTLSSRRWTAGDGKWNTTASAITQASESNTWPIY